MRAYWIDDTMTYASTRLCGGQENIAVNNKRIRLAMIFTIQHPFALYLDPTVVHKTVLDLAVYQSLSTVNSDTGS
jgi:hypothetical protein